MSRVPITLPDTFRILPRRTLLSVTSNSIFEAGRSLFDELAPGSFGSSAEGPFGSGSPELLVPFCDASLCSRVASP